MKLIAVASALGVASASMHNEWTLWKQKHGKYYSQVEETRRFGVFSDNFNFVTKHNADYRAGKETFHVAINQFSDLTNDEFINIYMGQYQDVQDEKSIRLNYQCPVAYSGSGTGAATVDWTTTTNRASKVAVTPVKDQGQCGSCWSFATTGTFEGQYCLTTGQNCAKWSGASEEQLCDCGGKDNAALGPYYDMGCNGGWIDNGLYYLQLTGYADTEANYPYTAGHGSTGSCKATQSGSIAANTNCGYTTKNSESELQSAIADVGPIGIAIDAGGLAFQMYSGGVYTSNSCSSSRLNHAVLAVGYGTQSNTPYWKVKNSWGTGWGDNGYILMQRNYNNMCGVAATPAYAIM